MPYQRDTDALLEAIKDYSPVGMPVEVEVLGSGVVEAQINARQAAFFKVLLDKPVPFTEYAKDVNASDRKMTREEVEELWAGRTMPLPEELLERGVSKRDILRYSLESSCQDCLDERDRVVRIVTPWRNVTLDPLEIGMMTEYVEEGRQGTRVIAGRLVGRSAHSVYLELFEPLTAMRLPEKTVADDIKKGFYSDRTWALSADTYAALEDVAPDTIPKGEWTSDREEYLLSEPVDIATLKEFCDKNYPKESLCLLSCLVYFIVPISDKGAFRPLRADEQMVDYYGEGFRVEYEYGL